MGRGAHGPLRYFNSFRHRLGGRQQGEGEFFPGVSSSELCDSIWKKSTPSHAAPRSFTFFARYALIRRSDQNDQRVDINNTTTVEQRRLVSVRTLTRTAAVFLIVISFFSLFFFLFSPASNVATERLQKGGRNVVSRVEHVQRELSLSLSFLLVRRRRASWTRGDKKKTRRSRCRETDRRKTPRDTESQWDKGRGFFERDSKRRNYAKRRKRERERERERKREDDASAVMPSQGERSVHSLSDQKLKATLNEMNAFTCLLHLPRHIHSPFHFKCSAALLWVAALSSRPSRCTHRSF